MSLATLVTSCMSMQSKSYVVLNPDMSGKCTYDIKMGKDMAGIMTMPKGADMFSGMGLMGKASKKTGPQDAALALASKLLSSGNVDAWKDVQFGYTTKDTVFFKGTAYFKDISKMAVSMLDSSMRIYKNSDGNTVLEMMDSKPKKDSTLAWKNHSYDSITSSVYKDLGLSDMMHYYIASLVKGLYVSATYQLPGKIVSSSNFVKKNDNTVSVTLTGSDVIKLLDSMSTNTDIIGNMYSKYMPNMGLGASNPLTPANDDNGAYKVDKILYGENKPVQVVYKSSGKMAFDYDKEVAEAKTYYAKFRRTSGIEQYDSVLAAAKKQEEEDAQREKGTLVLTAADSANGKEHLRTLVASQLYGDYINFTGMLSKPVSTSSVKVQITKATTDNGMNITDSINKKNNYYDYDSASIENANVIFGYLSPSNYNYDVSDTATTTAQNDKLTFSMSAALPEGAKYINIDGMVEIEEVSGSVDIPFKIINLYIKKDGTGLSKWK